MLQKSWGGIIFLSPGSTHLETSHSITRGYLAWNPLRVCRTFQCFMIGPNSMAAILLQWPACSQNSKRALKYNNVGDSQDASITSVVSFSECQQSLQASSSAVPLPKVCLVAWWSLILETTQSWERPSWKLGEQTAQEESSKANCKQQIYPTVFPDCLSISSEKSN